VLERLEVRAGQLPVIVNTAIVPCPCGRDAGGTLEGSIEPVEAAGTTLVLPPLPVFELLEPVLVEELPVPDDPVWVLLDTELPELLVAPVAVLVPVSVGEDVLETFVGAVPVDVVDGEDELPVVDPGTVAPVGVPVDEPSVPVVELGDVVIGVPAGFAGSTMLGGVPGP